MDQNNEFAKLKEKITRLEKTNLALIERVEKTVALAGNSGTLFHINSLLQSEIDKKSQQFDNTISEVEKQKRAINECLLISEKNARGEIIYVNDKFCETSGYTRKELIGKNHNLVKSNFHTSSFWKIFGRHLSEKRLLEGKFVINEKTENLIGLKQLFTLYLIKADKLKDIHQSVSTLRKKIEQLLSQHNEKLVSIGELAAGVGHEINNPLTIAFGNLTILKKLISLSLEVEQNIFIKINTIEKSLLRIKKIVDGLRLYSRADENTSESVSLVGVVVDTVDMEIPTDVDYIVDGNIGKFQQVLMNLISNARDATENRENRTIVVGLKKSSGEALLFVQDNGVGIPPHLLSKVTEPFFTTKRAYKGTGIGLGLVSKFVKEFNGRLEIESQENIGGTFRVFIPIKSEQTTVMEKVS